MAKAFCTQCQSNCYLKEHDDDVNDESYEFCPTCGSDQFLEPFKEGIVKTVIIPTELKAEKVFNHEEWEKKKEAEQDLQEQAIAKYHEVYESEGPEVAEQLYFKVLKNKQ